MKVNRSVSPVPSLDALASRQLARAQAELAGDSAVSPPAPDPAPPKPEKTAQKPAKPARPWEKADPEAFVGNTIKIPMPLYEKILWMKLNVPGPDRSIQKIAVAALDHWADLQIKKHWKGD